MICIRACGGYILDDFFVVSATPAGHCANAISPPTACKIIYNTHSRICQRLLHDQELLDDSMQLSGVLYGMHAAT